MKWSKDRVYPMDNTHQVIRIFVFLGFGVKIFLLNVKTLINALHMTLSVLYQLMLLTPQKINQGINGFPNELFKNGN
ncbi:hypothetical protein U3516DRAFT_736182 [Neocallimastix sp. 'constans']